MSSAYFRSLLQALFLCDVGSTCIFRRHVAYNKTVAFDKDHLKFTQTSYNIICTLMLFTIFELRVLQKPAASVVFRDVGSTFTVKLNKTTTLEHDRTISTTCIHNLKFSYRCIELQGLICCGSFVYSVFPRTFSAGWRLCLGCMCEGIVVG